MAPASVIEDGARKMETLHRVVYASRISPEHLNDLDETIRAILASAIRNNRPRGITGLLIAHRGWFVQALEGTKDSVHERFGAIVRDLRHRDAVILVEGPTEARMFGAWSMCSKILSPTDAAVLELLDQKASFDPADVPERTVIRLLTTVAAVHSKTLDKQQMAPVVTEA
jgi:hypothetical protein